MAAGRAVEMVEHRVVAAQAVAREEALEEVAPVVAESAAQGVVLAAAPAAVVRAVVVGVAATESVMPQCGVSSWRSHFSMAPVYHRSAASATDPAHDLPTDLAGSPQPARSHSRQLPVPIGSSITQSRSFCPLLQ